MSQNQIHIGRGLYLPIDAVTQTFAALAKRGAGKTYFSLLLAEQMLEAHAQIVYLDPVGKGWSLRLAADGKSPGFDVPVFGGHHGDLPLEPGAGRLLADLIVDRQVSAVLDVSLMRKGERKTFVTDFAEHLLLRKKRERAPSPMHLFLEESQVFVPQRTQRGEERMLGAFEDLVKLGRNYGIGATLISQRPQAVNKDVLTQTECLVVLQTIGAQERKALREWMREVGADRSEAIDELPGLERGEAYLWSPGWLREFRRIRIGKRKTFDASATPKVGRRGKAAAPRKLADDELVELRASMAEVVAAAEQNDPKALRNRLAAAERELGRLKAHPPSADPQALDRARAEGAREAEGRIRSLVGKIQARDSRTAAALERAQIELGKAADAVREPVDVDLAPARAEPRRQPAAAPACRAPAVPAGKPRSGQARMLATLAQMAPSGVTEAQWATLSGLKRTGGTWASYKSRLRVAGHIEEREGLFYATDAGLDAAGVVPAAPTSADEVLALWRSKPGMAPPVRLVEIVLQAGPMTTEALADEAGLTHGAGTFSGYLSRARTAGLLSTGDGTVNLGPAFDGMV